MHIWEQPQKRKPKCYWQKFCGLSWRLGAMHNHSKCSCSSIRSLMFVCKKWWQQQVYSKQPHSIKTCRHNWTYLWIIVTRFEGLSWSLHVRRRCVRGLAWDSCVLSWRKNDQHMSLMITLFLCWFCFVLLHVFSDDNNSKQKTPHKEPCTWQTGCWWDIQSLHCQIQQNMCENYPNKNLHCIKKIPQYPTNFCW